MSDELGKKIKQITDMLSQEIAPDNLKNFLSLLAGSIKEDSTSSKAEEQNISKENNASENEQVDSMEMMRKVKTIMDSINMANDPRVNLLTSLKPFLSNTRQKKINSCIKMLGMAKLIRLMDDDKSIL